MTLISVYAIIKMKDKTKNTGVWRGDKRTAPEGCIDRGGKGEVHYWIVEGEGRPEDKSKCMCGKARYKDED